MSGAAERPVTVAMLTYRRAEMVMAARAVLAQMSDLIGDLTLLVVDNDPSGSAAGLTADIGDPRVRYVHEPSPGIPAARNRALDEVGEDTLLVFIDDDERPAPRWLDLMLSTHHTFGGAGVVGAVVSEFEQEPDEWLAAGRFFDRRRLPTGTKVEVAATNNLLLDMRQVRARSLRFDERFRQSGGSDTLFSRQLTSGGGDLIWCDEAVVVDHVPASRLTRRWVLERAFRSGNSWSRTSLVLADSRSARIRARLGCGGTGLVRLGGGLVRLGAGIVGRSLPARVRGVRTVARGAGMIAGALGIVFREYKASAGVHSSATAAGGSDRTGA